MELANLLSHGADVNALGPENEETPLHCAVQNFENGVVKEFLRQGANPLAKNTYGTTPYSSLPRDFYSWSSIETLKALIDVNPELLLEAVNPRDCKTNFLHVLSEAPEFARDDRIIAKNTPLSLQYSTLS